LKNTGASVKFFLMVKRLQALSNYTDLFKKFKDKGSIKKGYIFVGTEDYLMDMVIDRICETLSAEKEIVDGSVKDFAGEIGLHLQGGLFRMEKVLVVKYVEREERVLKFLDVLLRTKERFVLVLRDLKDQSVKSKDVECIQFLPLDTASFKVWLDEKIKRMGKQLTPPELKERIFAMMPQDLRSCLNEIEKLRLYTYNRQFLKSDDLQVLSDYETARVSEVVRDVLSGEPDFFPKFLYVFEASEPTYITSALMWQLIREYNYGTKGSRFSKADLLRMMLLSARFDAQLKSSPVDRKLLVMQLLMDLKINVD